MTNPNAVPLREALTLAGEWVTVDPGAEYDLASVRLWGSGITLRARVQGTSIQGTRRRRLRAGQFLVARIDARHGAMGLVPPALDGALVSNDFLPFDVDVRVFEPAYLSWVSRSNWLVAACAGASVGTTNRVRLSMERFLEIRVSRPPLPEQRRITSTLDSIATRVDLLQGAAAVSQSTADDLFASGLTRSFRSAVSTEPSGSSARVLAAQSMALGDTDRARYNNAHPSRPTLLAQGPFEIPPSWCWTDLGSVATHIVDCVNDTPEFSDTDTGFLGLKSTNVRPFALDLSEVWYVTKDDHERWNRRVVPRPRDIILTREAPMGYACQLPEGISACLTQRLVLVRTDSRFVLPEFLVYYLNSSLFQGQLLSAQRGLTSRHIRVGDLPRFLIPLPPPADQRRMLAFLNRSRSAHSRLREVLAQRHTMVSSLVPSALMQLA